MDPDACWREIVMLAARIDRHTEDDRDSDPFYVSALTERVSALNDWLRKGGSAPKAWRRELCPTI